jgi:lipoprotein-anchoring transpeptidase ErfK/SrfK
MIENLHAAKEALRRSQLALRKGDKDTARRWAEKAATLAPQLEEPWLFLAAVSRPQLSIHYLQRALAINPASEKAQKGLLWAHKRLAEKQTAKPVLPVVERRPEESKALPVPQVQLEKTVPREPVGGILHTAVEFQADETLEITPLSSSTPKRSIWRQSLPAMLMTVIVVSAVWALFPRISSFAAGFNAEPTATFVQEYWGAAEISKPTYTPTSTATFTPTPTATITPSPTATFTPLPTNTPKPTAVPETPAQNYSTGGAKYVLVDISEQHMYAYEGNTLVFSFVASTGMNNATATGQFSVLNKIPSAYGSTWDIWMPYWLGIYWAGTLQNGIHALPIMSNGSILWDGYLGTPISYGCVVLGTYEAKLLYDWVDVGTPVEIQW